jgi:1-acyl-sn-glycerol-3-phosphate acyltransferase
MVALARDMVRYFLRGYHRVRVLQPCALPARGPAILVCNHISGLDPLLLQNACPRVIGWMMAREYYENPGLKWFLDLIGAVPVDRTGRDFASFRAALRALSAGRVLGIFPEGRINPGEQLLEFQTGIALLAMRSGAPVYPAAIQGSMRGIDMLPSFFLPQRAMVTFGTSVELPRSPDLDAAAVTLRIQEAIKDLYQQIPICSA